MFLAAVLAHHTADTPRRQQPSLQALPQPLETEAPIRQSMREESQRRDTPRPADAR